CLLTSLDLFAPVKGARRLVFALRLLPNLSKFGTRQPERVHELLFREQTHLEKPAVEALPRRHLFQLYFMLPDGRNDEWRLFSLSPRDACEQSFFPSLLILRNVVNNVLHVALLRFVRDLRRLLTRRRGRSRRGVLLLIAAKALLSSLRSRLSAAARRVRSKQYERDGDEREQERRSDRREQRRTEDVRRSQRPRRVRRARLDLR